MYDGLKSSFYLRSACCGLAGLTCTTKL